MPLIWNCNS